MRKRKRMQGFRPDIAPIFEPRSVVVFGASEREGSPGTAVFRNLIRARFKGKTYAVNPRHEKIQGRRCYKDIGSVPGEVDLAVIATPARTVPDILEDCGRHGIGHAVVISAGFREAGPEGKALEDRVLRVARDYGIRFLGPNCMGVMRPDIGLNASFSDGHARPGRIALVSQSGALCTAIMDWARPRGIGFSTIVSTGISADIDFGEILDYLVMDPATQAVMLYIEGLHDSRRFMSALRALSRAKPVIVMKAGRHAEGGRAAASHTGALVGSDEVFDAALRRAGVVRVHGYSHFFAAAATLHAGVRTPGTRLGILTNGGGPGVIAADYLANKKLDLARLSPETCKAMDEFLPAAWSGNNPVDVLGDATPERYARALDLCLQDEGVDAMLAILVPQAVTAPEPVAEAVLKVAGKGKPVLTCWMGDGTMEKSRSLFREAGLSTFTTPEAAVEAFAAAAAYHANQELLLQVPDPLSGERMPDEANARGVIQSALEAGREQLDAIESKAVLAAFGVPILGSLPAHDASEAAAVAQELGFPVAMKIRSPDITHKTDVDGVRLGLGDGQAVRKAYREMMEAVARARPEARLEGVMIERMWRAAHGRELMVGVIHDEVFGPVISVGLGGTLVEVIGDRCVSLPPLNRYLARRMIDSTRAAKYLGEFRGKPAANLEALENVILRVSEMVCELPEIVEMDINPLVVDENGATAIDARIRVRKEKSWARPYSHMAIHPYPSDLREQFELADGTLMEIRPIRPEDALRERDFVHDLSPRSRYLRFMYPLKEMTPEMLSRFTQIDYDREMALVATLPDEDGGRQVGVARYIIYPDGRGCEFAIVISDDMQRRGIATRLLQKLIDVARDRRLEHMDGLVLRENRNMLKLAKQLGFEQEPYPDDPDIVLMTLDL